MTATAAQLSHVYPLGSRVNERGHLEVGGCDAVELAREFGTPAYVVAEDDLRARARAFVGGLQLLCLGVIGEYLGRAYLKINHKPQFAIRESIGWAPAKAGVVNGE